jgi:hypothetical protein
MHSRTENDLIPAVRRTLEARTASAADAGAVAEVMAAVWQQLAARLEPVIGARGVEVVFDRALKLTAACRPALKIGDRGDGAAPLANFTTCLGGLETHQAIEASFILLATFIELLATLIGESLTKRLIDPVLAGLPDSEQETTS